MKFLIMAIVLLSMGISAHATYQFECPDGFEIYDNQNGVLSCVEITPDIIVDPVICNDGFELINDECVQIIPTCTINENLINNQCVPITCPSGYQLGDGICWEIPPIAVDPICEETLNLGECADTPITPICDIGYQLVNNECEEIPPIVIDEVCEETGNLGECEEDDRNGSGATPPTLGINTNSNILQVENGFICNGVPTNVNYWFTPYQQISLNVGDKVVCDFKVFDEYNGPFNIAHFEFALGKKLGETMSNEYGKLSLDIDQVTGNQTVTYPKDQFYNVIFKALPDTVECIPNEELQCRAFHLEFNSAVPFTDDIIIGTQVWNYQRSTWVNFFNHGIEIKGETLNELPTYNMIDQKGHMHTVQLTDKTLRDTTTVIDINTGQKGKIVLDRFMPELTSPVPVSDSDKNRHGTVFQSIKEYQKQLAFETAVKLYPKAYE